MPTAYEAELLIIMIEECAEVAQRATKMLRFGVDETQPGQPYDNATRLGHELGDLMAVIEQCVGADLVENNVIFDQVPIKQAKLLKFMQQAAPE